MRDRKAAVWSMMICAALVGCSGQNTSSVPTDRSRGATLASIDIDSARVVQDLRYLSAPELGGRATGSVGSRVAREYIVEQLRSAGVDSFGTGYSSTFPLPNVPGGVGTNVIGVVRGVNQAAGYIVVTAHYDHLGTVNGTVYPGADDNASGVAALLELARHVAANPLDASVIFAALDAEEMGLRGARAFVESPPVPLESIRLNINLDMVSRNEDGELYVAGAYHYPDLGALIDPVASRSEITLLRGHDRPGLPPGEAWTQLSEHAAFHSAGIPFVYFGVEDHADYHRPNDRFENTDPAFFVRAVRTVLDFLLEAGG